MHKPAHRLAVGLSSGLLFAVALIACNSTIAPTAPSTAPGISVSIVRDICPSLEVQQGGQVTWTNEDDREHVVQAEAPDGYSVLFDSGTLQPGDSFSFVFVESGQFEYRCSLDEGQAGTITVQS